MNLMWSSVLQAVAATVLSAGKAAKATPSFASDSSGCPSCIRSVL